MKQPEMPFCGAPFDDSAQRCEACKYRQPGRGFRRCTKMVARSSPMRDLLRQAAPIAMADAPVIIAGETGAGKEVLARALHGNSPRRNKPFVALNVAALPAELLESELFGYAKGAFTGAAVATLGLFKAAHGGTLLLDEIAEMPLALQAKVLRVLDGGEVRQVGAVQPFFVDVRILCTTHQDLENCVRERRFRDDLYHRLNVFTLTVPPLRQRGADILELAGLFLTETEHATGRLTAEAQRRLLHYDWPGNVRQLANAITHASVLSSGADVDVGHLPAAVVKSEPAPIRAAPLATLAEVEHQHVLQVLAACAGRPADAARVLGISRATLWRKLKGFATDQPRR